MSARWIPQGREGSWVGDRGWWVEGWEAIGPWLLLALVVVLVGRAWLRRRRYVAVDVLGADGEAALHEAVGAAERRTVGEIVPVVVERSDPHPAALWLAALATLLVGSATLEGVLPWNHPPLLLLCQIGLGAVGAALAACLPDLQRWFVFESRADEVVEEQAFQEFYRLGLHKTEAGTGVLLFVSLLERRVVVLADEGIATKVAADEWQATRDAVLEGIRRGSLRDGLRAGVARAGEVLAREAPWVEGDRDELPNRVVVRRE